MGMKLRLSHLVVPGHFAQYFLLENTGKNSTQQNISHYVDSSASMRQK